MRSLALLKKELRECLPWMLLSAIFFVIVGGILLHQGNNIFIKVLFDNYYRPGEWLYTLMLLWYQFDFPLRFTGPLLWLVSIGLGLILGIRQFWVPNSTRTWGFALHRSVKRETILWGKLTAAAITFMLSLGTLWIIFYFYTSRFMFSSIPPTVRIFIEGWLIIFFGFVIYLGTALAGLSKARWYTTKVFPLAFVLVIIATTVSQWKLSTAFAVMLIGSLILLSQVINAFLNREF